jgi:hypothetical protein
MLAAAIAAPKISFETFAMISSAKSFVIDAQKIGYVAANSITLSYK